MANVLKIAKEIISCAKATKNKRKIASSVSKRQGYSQPDFIGIILI
jgi:hypothetical protein